VKNIKYLKIKLKHKIKALLAGKLRDLGRVNYKDFLILMEEITGETNKPNIQDNCSLFILSPINPIDIS
jgi:hypothetical protein